MSVTFDAKAAQLVGGGRTLQMQRRPAAVFDFLWRRQGRMVPRSAVFEAIYSIDDEPESGDIVIESHVSNLRKAVRPFGVRIETHRHIGYRLIVERATGTGANT